MASGEIQEIRTIRHEISEECDHDLHRVAAYYRAVEQELKESGRFRFEERSNVSRTSEATDEVNTESAR